MPPDKHQLVLITLDKYDKIGVDGVAAELNTYDLPHQSTDWLVNDLKSDDWEANVRTRIESNSEGRIGLQATDIIASHVASLLKTGTVKVDPILARGLDYYTGPIFEFIANGGAGSIAGGGRYDNLSSLFFRLVRKYILVSF